MDAVALREAGRSIAAESALDDPLPSLDRLVVGSSVQIRIPLRDPQQVKEALKILRQVAEECLLHLERGGIKDRSLLFDVKGRIHRANGKINAYRRLRIL